MSALSRSGVGRSAGGSNSKTRSSKRRNDFLIPRNGVFSVPNLLMALTICLVTADQNNSDHVVPLLGDTQFRHGFTVWAPAPGKHVKQGIIRPGASTAEPAWGLAQWHSRYTLADAKPEPLPGGSIRFFDGAKGVTFFAPGSEADISLALDAIAEYADAAPPPGAPWPHLLAERSLAQHPSVTELKSLQFAIRFRLVKDTILRPTGFDLNRHTAQFLFYLTVQNRNRQSAGYGDYLWFGVPMYDTRYRLPRAHKAVDRSSEQKRGTGKFIFNPAGERYTTQSAHDHQWVTIEKDLLPLIHEALRTAWERGYLLDSQAMSDYQLGGMNMGWEVTGPLDVEVHVQGLRLDAILD
jgi:hypothetical protein